MKSEGRQGTKRERRRKGRSGRRLGRPAGTREQKDAQVPPEVLCSAGGCSDSHMPYDHNSRKGENHWLDQDRQDQTKKSRTALTRPLVTQQQYNKSIN
jgi:hypothetical protein